MSRIKTEMESLEDGDIAGDGARSRKVLVVCAGAVAGPDTPTTAAGLRVLGLAEGLRAHGFSVTTVGVVDDGRLGKGAGSDGVEAVRSRDLSERFAVASPATVVVVDPLDLDELPQVDGLSYVLDFCGAGMGNGQTFQYRHQCDNQ